MTNAEQQLARLVAFCSETELLSEGQLARVLDIDRVELRRLRDDGIDHMRRYPLGGEWGANAMKRMFGGDA
ncbi:MAG: hypothetical protein WBP38_00405 [Hyphomicrobium sp.]|nr:hypothetical protein [Hyphomicrobium sp.]